MATEITKAIVLPDFTLSLEIRLDAGAGAPDGFRVSVDGVDTDVALVEDLGYEAMAARYYLPRAVSLTPGEAVSVSVTPIADGVATGDPSAAVDVTAEHDGAPETVVRYLVADALSGAVSYDGDPVWVWRDRMGRPRTARGPVGKAGAVVDVGVVYMASEDTESTSTDSDTTMTVPVRVLVKGDDPDRGEDAVNIGWKVRQALANALDMNGFGIVGWSWSGSPPVQEGKDMLQLSMTMQIQRMGPTDCGA